MYASPITAALLALDISVMFIHNIQFVLCCPYFLATRGASVITVENQLLTRIPDEKVS